jgi:hypothetical protein
MLHKRTKAELDPEPARNNAECAFINYFSGLTFGTGTAYRLGRWGAV